MILRFFQSSIKNKSFYLNEKSQCIKTQISNHFIGQKLGKQIRTRL